VPWYWIAVIVVAASAFGTLLAIVLMIPGSRDDDWMDRQIQERQKGEA
jgi:hypothetical protein